MSAGRQRGFTYLGLLIVVAVMGAGLAAYGEIASHASQREREAELLFRGNQYRAAIASYYSKERRYPKALTELVEDRRYPTPVRHLRRLYSDPVSGTPAWGLIEAPEGGIMGVYSLSEATPIKAGNFAARDAALAEAAVSSYSDWKFFYQPAPSPSSPHSPSGLRGAVENAERCRGQSTCESGTGRHTVNSPKPGPNNV